MLSLTSFSLGFASMPGSDNPCKDAKPKDAEFCSSGAPPPCPYDDQTAKIENYFDNRDCAEMMDIGYNVNMPQSGMNVTAGYAGDQAPPAGVPPIMEDYASKGLCPVNVHWHLGAEHLSVGQYDISSGNGPHGHKTGDLVSVTGHRRLAEGSGGERLGLQCHHYDANDEMYTKPYEWKYCVGMEVGQTYEVHWPHSAAGACGTKWQMQTPFYDGVFCKGDVISLGTGGQDQANPLTGFNVHEKIGVQGQVFTIVNSEDPAYQRNNLFGGAWMDSTHWVDVAKYIGSTTGTSRDNEVCSMYAPITWQVDRTCHKVSAWSFDQMCKQMLNNADDMSSDVHAHGARELVAGHLASDTLHRKQ